MDTTNIDTSSILNSIKKLIGVGDGDLNFDTDLIMFINGVLMSLNQLGIGPPEGFSISDETQIWTDLIGTRKDLDGVRTYIYLKARLVFDPPQSSFLVEAIKQQITELEWRLNVQVEGGTPDG